MGLSVAERYGYQVTIKKTQVANNIGCIDVIFKIVGNKAR